MPWSNTPEERQRSSRVYGAEWRRKRQVQLERDRYRCQLQLEGCIGRATEVDHILGVDADPGHNHLRSVCASCHRQRTAQQGGGFRSNPGSRRAPDPPHRPNTQW
jgi:5-methylcytosine-specific restriction endonuclease McrA